MYAANYKEVKLIRVPLLRWIELVYKELNETVDFRSAVYNALHVW